VEPIMEESATTIADTLIRVGGRSISTATEAAMNTRGWRKDCAGGGGYVTHQDQSLNQEANTGQGAFFKAVAKHGLNDSPPVKEG